MSTDIIKREEASVLIGIPTIRNVFPLFFLSFSVVVVVVFFLLLFVVVLPLI